MSKKEETKLVQVPSPNKIPERDIDKRPILEASHLGIDFGGLTAVDDFNMAIGRTEIAGLIGPNGAGKTTVFNLLTKVYQPSRGTILLDGLDTAHMTTTQANKAGIARTFQNIRLFDKLSVEDNVKIGLHNHYKYGMWDGVFRTAPLLEGGEAVPRARTGTAEHLRYAGSGLRPGRFPPLRRTASSGDRPRSGHRT